MLSQLSYLLIPPFHFYPLSFLTDGDARVKVASRRRRDATPSKNAYVLGTKFFVSNRYPTSHTSGLYPYYAHQAKNRVASLPNAPVIHDLLSSSPVAFCMHPPYVPNSFYLSPSLSTPSTQLIKHTHMIVSMPTIHHQPNTLHFM